MSKITEFFCDHGTDNYGRTFGDLVTQDDLERGHDYIQWLFPLPEASAFNPNAPMLTQDDIETIQRSPVAQLALFMAHETMTAFYGIELDDIGLAKRKLPERNDWLTPNNHNYLRITRILRSLTLLGQRYRATKLLYVLEHDVYPKHHRVIGEETLGYWRRAVRV